MGHRSNLVLVISFIVGCQDSTSPSGHLDFGHAGTGLRVDVVPQAFGSLTDTCISFAVVDGDGSLVVGRGPALTPANLPAVSGALPPATGPVCASHLGEGHGGALSIVVPCASAAPEHTVHLWVDSVCDGSGCAPLPEGFDPCRGPNGCALDVTCVEDDDTPVTFDLAFIGERPVEGEGAVRTFGALACEASLATCGVDGTPLAPLEIPGAAPMEALGLSIACTPALDDASDLRLTFGELVVTCDGAGGSIPMPFPEAGGVGELNGLKYQASFGTEAITPPVASVNVRVGVPAGAACAVSWAIVPSLGALPASRPADTFAAEGLIRFEGGGVRGASQGCSRMWFDGSATSRLNGQPTDQSFVSTGYRSDDPDAFQGVSQYSAENGAFSAWPAP